MIKIETKQGKTVTEVKGDVSTVLTELVVINIDIIKKTSTYMKIDEKHLLDKIIGSIKSELT